jgi:hypothetical protein
MTFVVQAFSTPFEGMDAIKGLFVHLNDSGYKPLITQAKQRFLSTFDENISIETLLNQMTFTYDDDMYRETIQSYLQEREFVSKRGGSKIAGDIFFSPSGEGILYLLIYGERATRVEGKMKDHLKLEIGYLGNSNYSKCLIDFRKSVTEILMPKHMLCKAHISQEISAELRILVSTRR